MLPLNYPDSQWWCLITVRMYSDETQFVCEHPPKSASCGFTRTTLLFLSHSAAFVWRTDICKTQILVFVPYLSSERKYWSRTYWWSCRLDFQHLHFKFFRLLLLWSTTTQEKQTLNVHTLDGITLYVRRLILDLTGTQWRVSCPTITLRQDFRDIMEESSHAYVFIMCTEGHMLIKNYFKIPHSVTEGRENAIQRKYLVWYNVSKIFNKISLIWI